MPSYLIPSHTPHTSRPHTTPPLQELREILERHKDHEYTNMYATAFNILRYDADGKGGLTFHIDMVRAPKHLTGIEAATPCIMSLQPHA